jgi:hypothetical protein
MWLIAAEEVPCVFDDAAIRRLADADIARLPSGADLKRFADAVRYAVRVYVQEAREPDNNGLFREIQALYSGAHRKQYERVAQMLTAMSGRCRESLMRTADTPALRSMYGGMPPALPTAQMMLDPSERDDGCRLLELLCVRGAHPKLGRWRHDSGRRSRPTLQIVLSAPQPKPGRRKLKAERELAFHVGRAYWTATGRPPPRTASAHHLGPFARLLAEVLRLSGYCGGRPESVAVELIKSVGAQYWPAQQ